jgi:hypothetical protein
MLKSLEFPRSFPQMGKKNNKKDSRAVVDLTTSQTADEFDDMLSELRASDLATASAGISSTITTTTTSTAIIPAARSVLSSSSSARVQESSSTGQSNSAAGVEEEIKVPKMVLIAVCRRGDVRQLKMWGRQGVRCPGASPLNHAAALGRLDVIQCLVNELGADVKQVDQEGSFPLYIAAQQSHLDVVRCLVKDLGADVNQARQDGATPLYIAAQQGYLDIVCCLVIELGVDANKAMHDGCTPSYIAAQNGFVEVIRCLSEICGRREHTITRWTLPLVHCCPKGAFGRCALSCQRTRCRRQPSE